MDGACGAPVSMKNFRVRDFQRNTAFVAFIFVVCFACFVFVMQNLRNVLVPLVWSAFFAVPLTALISDINQCMIYVINMVCRLLRRGEERIGAVPFKAVAGENVLVVEKTQAVMTMLKRVNHPTRNYCGKWTTKFCGCCRRRVRIATLEGEDDLLPEKNRLVRTWAYYARDPWQGADSSWSLPHGPSQRAVSEALAEADGGDVEGVPSLAADLYVELFVDNSERYPAVIDLKRNLHEPVPERRILMGTLEIDGTSSLSWFLSVVLAMGLVVGGIVVFVVFISLGANALQQSAAMYQKGAEELLKWLGGWMKDAFPKDVWDGMDAKAQAKFVEAIPDLATSLLSFAEGMGWQALLFLMYLCFWIFEPLPINSSVAHVFKSYFLLKTLVCLLFAGMMSVLLLILGCKFWHLFFLITFVLNYIPEIGPLMAACLMVPAVALDGSVDLEDRYANTFWLIVFGVSFKILTGNIIEVQMYATRGGEFMRMHPVILMVLMMFCETLMGITGMFLAVPIMAAVKYYLVSVDMPSVYLDPLLMLLEGDAHGPHKNFVDRRRVEMKAREDEIAAEISREFSETGTDLSNF